MATQDAPFAGGRIPPCWRILAPGEAHAGPEHPLILGAGPGFGTGSHPTTQLCLRGLAALAPKGQGGWRLLDFGAGSGILSLAGARLGAQVAAVEIEELALASLASHLRWNGLEEAVALHRTLAEAEGPYDFVVANILRPVLLPFAEALVARLAPGGCLLLSGLTPPELPELAARYAPLLSGQRSEAYRQGDWVALAWTKVQPSLPA